MRHKIYKNITEDLLNEIIMTAYGDAPYLIRRKIKSLAKQNSEINTLLKEYQETVNSVRKIKEIDCPDSIVQHAEKISKTKSDKRSFLTDWITIWYTKPFIASVTSVVVILILLVSVFINHPERQITPTDQEVRLAEIQTQKALEIVGKIFAKTRNTFENDVMKEHVSKPINKGINKINNLFNTGGNNENPVN